MRLLSWTVGFSAALVAVLFVLSNREAVSLTLWPFPLEVEIVISTIVLASVLAGFLIGSLVTWVAAGKDRSLARQQKNEIVLLESEVRDLGDRLDRASNEVD